MTTYGFQTSKGSLYVRDPQGRTRRYKISQGAGQGAWQPFSHCLYVPNIRAPVDLYQPGERILLGYVNETNLFKPFGFSSKNEPEPMVVPQGCCPTIIVQNKASGKVVKAIRAELNPAAGLTPVEKTYDRDRSGQSVSINHVGHPITSVMLSLNDLRSAARNLGLKELPVAPEYVHEYNQQQKLSAVNESSPARPVSRAASSGRHLTNSRA